MASQRKGSSETAPSDSGFLKQFHHLPKLVVFDLDYTLWPYWVDTHIDLPIRKTSDGTVCDRRGTKLKIYAETKKVLETLKENKILIAAASRTQEPPAARDMLKYFDIDKYFDFKEIYPGEKTAHFHRFYTLAIPCRQAEATTKTSKFLFHCYRDGNSVDSELNLISLYPEVKDILQSMSKHFLLAVASRVEDITVAYQLLSFCQISSYFPLKEIYPTSKSIHLKRLQARSGHHAHEMLFFDDDKRNIRDSKNIGVQAVQVLNGLSWHVVIEGLSLFSQSQSSI
ncbi:magnesium-dependent phosphatase 1-like isoform X2 [Homalodisca vitripennis]|nr:magnesium-dependent phosphatase 1-like isoform X2 [Homalodisca vitripennis]XP_046673060.1 magnesium-dependent phosphatase 1-like isoform X2 [Homalodisca vitripennis]